MLAYEQPGFGMDRLPGLAAQPAPRSRSEIEMGKVFVGGLARETTTEGLRGYFERFGDISDCVVMKDRATGLPRGFGFVTYASQMVADRVVHHRHVIDGKEVEAKPAVPRDSEMLARPGAGGGGLPGLTTPAGFSPAGLLGAGGLGGVPGQQLMQNNYMGGPQQAQFPGGAGAGANSAEASRKIFVGGLSHETSEADFNAYFGAPRATAAPCRMYPFAELIGTVPTHQQPTHPTTR